MTIQERLVEKFRHLSPSDQRRLLELATRLEQPASPPRLHNPRGMLAGLGAAVSEEDIADMRRDPWAKFPRDFTE